jgi:hypothetical protein
MQINEMHTQLAKLTDHFTLINSMSHPGSISNHFDAMHNLLSGQSEKRVQQGVSDEKPYLGSFVAKHKPSTRNFVSNAWLIKCVGPPVFCAPNIGLGGYLGSAYAPVFVGSETNHPAMPDFKPPQIYDTYDEKRFDERKWLLGRLDSNRLDRDKQVKDWSDLREKTYDAMTRSEGRLAFDLTREPTEVRERYGMHPLGQNLLLARRMVERGVRFVQIYSGGAHNDDNWDAHTDMEANHNLHAGETDKPIAGLIKDLKDRGLLKDTLIVWGGEFGRQPTAEYATGSGRDHNSYGFTTWMAGGGIRGGTTVGTTDEIGSRAVDDVFHVKHMHATVLHQLGLDPAKLTYFFGGLDNSLVGVEGAQPIWKIMS